MSEPLFIVVINLKFVTNNSINSPLTRNAFVKQTPKFTECHEDDLRQDMNKQHLHELTILLSRIHA